MTREAVRYDAADGVAVITIDRPEKRNALTEEMCLALNEAWLRVRDDDAVRAAVLTSTGDDVFCAGADLTSPPASLWKAVPEFGVQLDKPIVAAVAGKVIGAAVTLVTMCDLCVAADNTTFAYPEAKIGVTIAGVAGIAARIPLKIAMELMLLGEPIDVRRAYEVGYVNRVVPLGEQRLAARAMASALAANAPLAVGLLKRFALETVPPSPMERHYAARRAVDGVLESEDAAEGLRAFREKRRPVFAGR